ncbi:MAG: hypothetical protein WBM59_16425 [Sedimenticolaceae bacterium]
MKLFQKLPGSRREPPGLERRIMAKLPLFLAAGTAIPLFCYLIAAMFPPLDLTAQKYVTGVGIAAVAAALTAWTAAFTVAIGCLVVMIMKGPAYVADGYPLIDAEEPRQKPASEDEPPPDR